MIESFSGKLADYFSNNGYIDESQKTVYKYGTVIAIQSALNIVSTLLIGLVFRLFFENLCFFLVFRLIRRFSGGFHCDSFPVCFLLSVTVNIVVLTSFPLLITYLDGKAIITIEVISSILIIIFSPISHTNKQISKKESKVYRFIISIICILVLVCSAFLTKQNSPFAFSLCVAVETACVLLIMGKVQSCVQKK